MRHLSSSLPSDPSPVPHIFRRLLTSGLMEAEDVTAMMRLGWRTATLPARSSFDPGAGLALLATGLMVRRRDDAGETGQYLSLLVPGDPCSYAFITGNAPPGELRTVTQCRIMQIEPGEVLELVEARHGVLAALLSHMALDSAAQEELLVSISTRSALERTAHFLCELQFRLQRMGLGGDPKYFTSLTQAELGRYLGLSAVHVNRTLQELRRRGCLDRRGDRVVLDVDALKALASFEPGYLIGRRLEARAHRYDA